MVIRLKSTLAGFSGGLLTRLFWIAVFACIRGFFMSRGYGILKKYKIDSFIDYWSGSKSLHHPDDSWMFLYSFLACIGLVIIFCIACDLISEMYKASTLNEIDLEKGTIKQTKYAFPFKLETADIRFDRIMKVEMFQGSVGRLFNVGNLTLILVTFTNAAAVETRWEIPFIAYPEHNRDQIMSDTAKPNEIQVKLAQAKSAPHSSPTT